MNYRSPRKNFHITKCARRFSSSIISLLIRSSPFLCILFLVLDIRRLCFGHAQPLADACGKQSSFQNLPLPSILYSLKFRMRQNLILVFGSSLVSIPRLCEVCIVVSVADDEDDLGLVSAEFVHYGAGCGQ